MRFPYINQEKRDAVFVGLIEPFERPRLGAEGRSRIAPEYQDDGTLVTVVGETDLVFSMLSHQREIRADIANLAGPLTQNAPGDGIIQSAVAGAMQRVGLL